MGLARYLLVGALVLGASPSFAQTAESYVYDVLGRVTGATQSTGATTANVSGYAYDTGDNRTLKYTDAFNQPAHNYELMPGEQMVLRQTLLSPNGLVSFTIQSDGNMLLGCTSGLIWSSATYGTQALFLRMQTDGNLVLYGANSVIWASNTYGHPGARLSLQNDGNLVIYEGFVALWSTSTGGFC